MPAVFLAQLTWGSLRITPFPYGLQPRFFFSFFLLLLLKNLEHVEGDDASCTVRVRADFLDGNRVCSKQSQV